MRRARGERGAGRTGENKVWRASSTHACVLVQAQMEDQPQVSSNASPDAATSAADRARPTHEATRTHLSTPSRLPWPHLPSGHAAADGSVRGAGREVPGGCWCWSIVLRRVCGPFEMALLCFYIERGRVCRRGKPGERACRCHYAILPCRRVSAETRAIVTCVVSLDSQILALTRSHSLSCPHPPERSHSLSCPPTIPVQPGPLPTTPAQRSRGAERAEQRRAAVDLGVHGIRIYTGFEPSEPKHVLGHLLLQRHGNQQHPQPGVGEWHKHAAVAAQVLAVQALRPQTRRHNPGTHKGVQGDAPAV